MLDNVLAKDPSITLYYLPTIESNTQWTQHGTDSDLVQRIGDIDDWKKTLITTLQNVETEITKVCTNYFRFCCLQCPCYHMQLSEHKQLAEKALEAKNIPLAVVLECLSYREQRVSIDLVRDEVETELQKVKINYSCIIIMRGHVIYFFLGA